MELLTLSLIAKEANVKVDLNPRNLVMIVDGTPFVKGATPCTQVTVVNGEKFFVTETVEEIKNALRKF
jgi:hypothetical protein